MKKTLLLTFDYELYLGKKSGSVMKCSLLPADKIITTLNTYGCKGIFFIDALYLVRLKEVAQKHDAARLDFEKITRQIQRMIHDGHHVFNHLHPHWLDAEYNSDRNDWTPSSKNRFALNNLTSDEQVSVFEKTMGVLYEIIRPVSATYQIKGFRAGGLFIQPFNFFKPLFIKHGIVYEFSVLTGAKGSGPDKTYSFDFSQTPDKPFYRFDDDVTVETPNGPFVQFPLRVCEVGGLPKILSGIYYRLTKKYQYWKPYGDGLPTNNKIQFNEGSRPTGKFLHRETYSVESMNMFKLSYFLREMETRGHLHIISHPKLASDYNLEVLGRFLKIVCDKFEFTTDIETIIAQN